MPMNLREFSELAGVSTATASRALSGSGRMTEATRTRIRDLAEGLGYQPNMTARNLRTQRTMTIGVLVPMGHEDLQHLSDPFFNTIIGYLADELAEKGYDLLLSRVLPKDDRWLDAYVGSGRVDGIVIVGQSNQQEVIEATAARYLPMVVWGGQMPGQLHCAVGSDNRAGGRLAAEHLIAQGCRRIAYAGPSIGSEFGERMAGVQETLHAHDGDIAFSVLSSHFEPRAALDDFVAKLRDLPELPDGIAAGCDVTAISVIRALAELDHAVPQDVRVIGYDGLPIGEHVALTTIDQQLRHGAAILTDLLMRRIAGEAAPSVRIAPRLIRRHSA